MSGRLRAIGRWMVSHPQFLVALAFVALALAALAVAPAIGVAPRRPKP